MALINLTTDMTEPEERAAQNSNNNYLLKIAGGSPRGVYTSLSALNAAHPNGADGIYVVTSNGNWYYWSGTAWVSGGVYQATALADSSVTSSKIASNAVTSSKIANGAVTPSKLAADVVADINSKISVTPIGTGINIDNLYGSSNHGVYYVKGAGGTKPEGEIQGILWVYDDGGNWTRQVWLGNRCHTRLNRSTSTANWDAWSNIGPEYTAEEKNKLAGIEAGAQVNKIDTIKLNGVTQSISSKTVDLKDVLLAVSSYTSLLTSDKTVLGALNELAIVLDSFNPYPANMVVKGSIVGQESPLAPITITSKDPALNGQNLRSLEGQQGWAFIIAELNDTNGNPVTTGRIDYGGGYLNCSVGDLVYFYQTGYLYNSAEIISGDTISSYLKGNQPYSALNTEDKTIFGAINELHARPKAVAMTQAEYDALTEYDPDIIYVVGD